MAVQTKLWRKEPSTNQWKLVRECDVSSAHQWLLDAKATAPDTEFKLSPKRPAY